MSDIAIKVENLGKKYIIRHEQQSYLSFREEMAKSVIRLGRKLIRREKEDPSRREEFWALKDVSFDIKFGDRVGIIGRNGAGKSTLLKILSRITEPTTGKATLCGRVASLLEVGTGFHPELTGRENIYLNGAILGMSNKEIKRKFDEIVAFSEVEKFLDTPVKRYSSGMYVRLAFAVAAHLEPEILVIDEVLAVGDAQFQKKCLSKMNDVSKTGRTILFVSHQMAAINTLCSRGILLDKGSIYYSGDTNSTVETYLNYGRDSNLSEKYWHDFDTAPGDNVVRLKSVRVLSDGAPSESVDIDKETGIEIEFWNLVEGTAISSSIHLIDSVGNCVLASANYSSASINDPMSDKKYPKGLYKTVCKIPPNFLNDTTYHVSVWISSNIIQSLHVRVLEAVSFMVHDTGAMRKELMSIQWIGAVRPILEWNTRKVG